MANVSDSSIAETYNAIRKDGDTNWMLLGYQDNKTIVLKASGSGGVSELASHLTPNDCYFGYLRVVNKDDETTRTKFVFFTFKGDNAPVMRKGNMSVHVSNVKTVIKDYNIEFHASDPSDVTEEEVTNKLKKANY